MWSWRKHRREIDQITAAADEAVATAREQAAVTAARRKANDKLAERAQHLARQNNLAGLISDALAAGWRPPPHRETHDQRGG